MSISSILFSLLVKQISQVMGLYNICSLSLVCLYENNTHLHPVLQSWT